MRILLICEPDRIDWYYFLYEAKIKYTIDLLWFETKADAERSYTKFKQQFDNIFCWNDFLTPGSLLKRTKPDRIVFFEIIDHRQISLIIAANKLGIQTIFLDHGAAGDVNSMRGVLKNRNFFKQKIPYYISRLSKIGYLVKSKYFYYSAFFSLTHLNSVIPFLLLPIKSLFYTNPVMTLTKSEFRERVPKRVILFSEANMQQFLLQVGKLSDGAVITGVPYFDKYYSREKEEQDYIVFIDHPYFEDNLLNWTQEFHEQLASNLFSFAEGIQKKLFIKLHPRSKKSLWDSYSYNRALISVIQGEKDYTNLLTDSKLIIGYSSSLLNGLLCARKNIVNVGWHPVPQIFGVDFAKTGLCHGSLNMNDLKANYSYWIENNLAECNEAKYEEFLRKFNYPFDGKATDRVLKAIQDQ